MTTISVGAVGAAGFVRSCFSKRNGVQAVQVDLVRVVLRVANVLSAERHNEAMRARLAEDFGGYLVTEENPSDMTAAEMAACWPFASSIVGGAA